jgi:hypothetical protein
MKIRTMNVLIYAAIGFLAGTASASDGVIPLYAPGSIGESGSYRLTRDIDTTSGTVFTINAADVTIDLAGHKITAAGGTAFALNANTCTLRVKNGAIRAEYSFYTYMKMNVRVEVADVDITTTSSGFGFYLNAEDIELQVERVRVEAVSATRAIFLMADTSNQKRTLIRDSYFDTTSSGTIFLDNVAGLRFENNVMRGHGYPSATPAVYVMPTGAAESVVVRGNEIALASGAGEGIVINPVDSALVADNTVVVPGTGIRVKASTSIVRGNTVHAAGVCIEAYGGALVAANVLGSCDTGLYARDSTVAYKDNYFRALDAVLGTAIDGGGNVGN